MDRLRSIGVVHSSALDGTASHAPAGTGIGLSPGLASTPAYRAYNEGGAPVSPEAGAMAICTV